MYGKSVSKRISYLFVDRAIWLDRLFSNSTWVEIKAKLRNIAISMFYGYLGL